MGFISSAEYQHYTNICWINEGAKNQRKHSYLQDISLWRLFIKIQNYELEIENAFQSSFMKVAGLILEYGFRQKDTSGLEYQSDSHLQKNFLSSKTNFFLIQDWRIPNRWCLDNWASNILSNKRYLLKGKSHGLKANLGAVQRGSLGEG